MEEKSSLNPGKRSAEDQELIREAQAGQAGAEKAYQRLMMKYRKSVYYLIFKMVRNPQDAEDLTQETFVKAFGSLHKFDPKFAFSTWVFKIASNSTIDFIRKQRMKTLSINETGTNDEGAPREILQIEDTDLIPHDRIMREQRKEYLQLAIDTLPERYRRLIVLRYFDELSYEEISEKLELPLGTVKAQLHRSRELLNDALGDMESSL